MSGRPALLVNALELLRVPGTCKHISDRVPPAEIDAESDTITGDIAVEVDLESTVDDIGLTGTISVPWSGHCRRCLRPLAETLIVDVDERYAPSTPERSATERLSGREDSAADGAFPIEPYPIVRGQIDLRPMVRDEVLLAVGEARLCRPDCPGLCPICGRDVSIQSCDCDATLVDDRWAVLDQLRADD